MSKIIRSEDLAISSTSLPTLPPPKQPIFPKVREILYPIIPGGFDEFDKLRSGG